MKKPLQKSGVLGVATNLNQKTNPYLPGFGLYKFDGWWLPETQAITKFGGITKLNTSVIDESAFNGTNTLTGLFNYFPQNPYALTSVTLPTSATWKDIAYDAAHKQYVAVASDSRTTLTSTDGKTWTAHANALPATGYVNVMWCGTFLLAISTNNKSSKSVDGGVTWAAEATMPTAPASTAWSQLAWDGTVAVAICSGVANTQAASTPDGVTWTSRTINTSKTWASIASDGSRFVVVANGVSGTGTAISTDHGVTWTTGNTTIGYVQIRWTNTFFVASGGSGVTSTSVDGVTWVGGPIYGNAIIDSRGRVAWNGKYLVMGDPNNRPAAYISTDGLVWSLIFAPALGVSALGHIFASDGTNFVAISGTSPSTAAGVMTFATSAVLATTENSLYSYTPTTFAEITTKLHGYASVSGLYDAAMLNDILYLGNGSNFNHKYYGGVVHNQGIIPPSTPPTIAAQGAGLSGIYSYKVTFVNQVLGHESNPSPKSTDLNLSNQGVSLTNIPVSSDPQVTARNIYRTTAGGGVWLLVATLNDNTTTSMTDGAADATLGIAVDNTGNGVPPLWSLIETMNGFAFMVPKGGSRIWFSKVNFPNAVDSNDFRDLAPNDGTVITGLRLFRKMLVAFKNKSIWNGFGTDRYSFGFDPQVQKVGSVNNAGIVEVPGKNVLAFIDEAKRFYFYDGVAATPTAGNIEPVLRNISTANLASVVGTIHKATNQCRWVVRSGGATQGDLLIWYDYILDKWGTRTLTNTKTNYIASLLDSNQQEQCYIGGYTGQVWTMDSGTSDDGAAMTATVMDRGHPGPDENGQQIDIENMKFFEVVWLFFKPQAGVVFNVYAVQDDPDGTPVLIGTVDGSKATGIDHVHFRVVGRRCYIQITENSGLYTPTIRGWLVGYKVVGRSHDP